MQMRSGYLSYLAADYNDASLPLAAQAIVLTPNLSKRKRRSGDPYSDPHSDSYSDPYNLSSSDDSTSRVERQIGAPPPDLEPLKIKVEILGYLVGMWSSNIYIYIIIMIHATNYISKVIIQAVIL